MSERMKELHPETAAHRPSGPAGPGGDRPSAPMKSVRKPTAALGPEAAFCFLLISPGLM